MVSQFFNCRFPLLTGLALFFASSPSAQSWVNGEMRFDGLFKQDITTASPLIEPEARNDSYELARLRLVFNHLFNDNRYYARVVVTSPESDVFQVKKNLFYDNAPLAKKLHLGEVSIAVNHQGLVSTYGRIEAPEISDEHALFQLGIGERIGTTLGRTGYKLGVRADFKQRALGAQVGLWQQTSQKAPQSITPVSELVTPSKLTGVETALSTNLDKDEVAQSLTAANYSDNTSLSNYGWGGRVAYMPYYNPYHTFGGGLGFRVAPLDTPLVMAVLYRPYAAPAVSQPAQGFYRLVSFTRLQELRFDVLRTYGQFYMCAGSSFQRMSADQKASVLPSDDSAGAPLAVDSSAFIFEDPGRSFGYYVEGAYLLGARSYNVCRERSAIMGVRAPSSYGAIEFGARFGIERYTNILGLLQKNGATDFTSSAYDGGTVSGQGRITYDLSGEPSREYSLLAINNYVADDDQFIVPQTKEEYSFFGLGQKKNVVYSYKTSAKGLSLHVNYYYNESTRLQVQFESLHYKKDVISRDSGMVDSINYEHITQWQIRLESRF